jgi:LPS export ABC transporter protein LptC
MWGLIILLLGTIAITIWGLQSGRQPASAQISEAADATPSVELRGSTLTHYDSSGHLLWAVASDALRYQQGLEQTTAQDVQVQFFSGDRPSLQLRAARLVFFNQSGDLALSGKLVAQDDKENLRFQTEGAYWSDREEVLHGEAPLEIERDDLTLEGAGFSYWPAEDKLQVQSAQLRFWPGKR